MQLNHKFIHKLLDEDKTIDRKALNLTLRIIEGLREIPLIESGQQPAKTAREFLKELHDA